MLSSRAFTLVEMLVALAIMAVIVVVSIASLPQFLGARSLDAVVSNTISLLEEARQLTLASKDVDSNPVTPVEGSQYGVYFSTTTSPHSATLFSGSSFDPANPANAKKTINFSGVEISQLNFANTALNNSVVFNRLTGATNNWGSITFRDKRTGKQKGVSVAGQGYVATGNNLTQLGWTRKKTITLNNPTSSVLQNFPVLIRLSEPKIEYDDFLSTNDSDLQFFDADDATPLDYEIESWNTSGESIIWVRVPTLQPGTDTIYMYYRKSGELSHENRTGVWDDNFVAVLHMDELSDSTSYAQSVLGQNQILTSSGLVGSAYIFDGITDRFVSLTMSNYAILSPLVTLEIWVKPNSNTNAIFIDSRIEGAFLQDFNQSGISASSLGVPLYRVAASGCYLGICAYYGNTTVENQPTWTYLAETTDVNGIQNILKGYQNGANNLTQQIPTTYGSSAPFWGTSPLRLGAALHGGVSFARFNGVLDEVRISKTARSTEWIKASYENQKINSNFVTIE